MYGKRYILLVYLDKTKSITYFFILLFMENYKEILQFMSNVAIIKSETSEKIYLVHSTFWTLIWHLDGNIFRASTWELSLGLYAEDMEEMKKWKNTNFTILWISKN